MRLLAYALRLIVLVAAQPLGAVGILGAWRPLSVPASGRKHTQHNKTDRASHRTEVAVRGPQRVLHFFAFPNSGLTSTGRDLKTIADQFPFARRPLIAFLTALVVAALWACVASAHHSASGLSGGLTALTQQRGKSTTSAGLALEQVRTKTDDGVSSSLREARMMAEVALSGRFAVGGALPLVATGTLLDASYGLGRGTVYGKWLSEPSGSSGSGWLMLSEVALPTQTLTAGLDPGPVTTLTQWGGYTWRHERWFLQPRVGLALDARRAGYAADLPASVHGAWAWTPELALTLTSGGVMRAATLCASPTAETSLCTKGRVSEVRTPTGGLSLWVEAGAEFQLTASLGMRTFLRAPATQRTTEAWRAGIITVWIL